VARDLVARAKAEIADTALLTGLLQLIETVIIYKLRRLGRQEIQTMLQISDLRDTRVYQEAMEEGREEGREEGKRELAARAIRNLSDKRMLADEIAAVLGVDVAFVQEVLKEQTGG
jgi:predicted transposase/invertase (TIGR01784 family)